MLEAIILGIVQGIAEWLPISSEGLLILVKINIFGSQESLDILIKEALFLHLGTFLAALIYFRQDVLSLIKTFFNYKSAEQSKQQILKFLIISTLISGCFGLLFIKGFENLDIQSKITARVIALIIGFLLLFTAGLQIKASSKGYKKYRNIKNRDSILLGFMQGLAVLPGLSRSGLTVSTLLLRKFDKVPALKLSFLMSLPIVLAGNIILNINQFVLTKYNLLTLLFSFIFGILTIGFLLKIARKINFGYFVFAFGILTIISVFI